MAQRFPSGQFNVKSLMQPGVATSYNGRAGERHLHTVPQVRRETEEWYKNGKFYEAIKAFHDTYARQPNMTAARQTHEEYIRCIQSELKAAGICRKLEFTGSAYEGVKVGPDLEFDVMVVMEGGDQLVAQPIGKPGFVKLVNKESSLLSIEGVHLAASLVTPDEQSPESTAQKFKGALQRCINKSPDMKKAVVLCDHGPAIQMDVSKVDNDESTKFYSVDMVPTYIVDGKLYVAKPFIEGDQFISAWRQSFSLEEKAKMVAIDGDNGCRKQVLRVLKAIRNRSTELHPLVSYHLKTALFKVIDEKESKYNWAFDRLGDRVIDVLKKLEGELGHGCMPHYYTREVNLIGSLSRSTMDNLENRIHKLCANEEAFKALLK